MTRRTVAALALVLALSATAQAAQLYSPPMFPDSDANLECLIVNVSDVTHAVTITARSINGGDVGG
jgi:PhoPQ-activated pathogenicity-related protein